MEPETRLDLILKISWLDDDHPERADAAVACIVAMEPTPVQIKEAAARVQSTFEFWTEGLTERAADLPERIVAADMGHKMAAELDAERQLAVLDRAIAALQYMRDRDFATFLGDH